MDRIEGRIALVTGAAGGIGLAVSEALVAAGARVVMTDIDAAELERSAACLGPAAAAITLDVTDLDQWATARAFAERCFGPVDILINNAGIGPDGHALADMDPIAFDRVVRIKLHGAFNGIATFAAGMRARGIGHIVNTASMAGLIASARLGAYTASKFAVVGMTEVLRAEMESSGVGVSVLCPGLVRTRLGETTAAAGSDRVALPTATTQAGIDPAIVGDLVIEGILANRLHIVTHGEYRDIVAQRMERVLSAFDGVAQRSRTELPGAEVASH